MTLGGRILISSKRVDTSQPRQPVPGCYCTRRPKKVRYRSANTIHQGLEPCLYCKSHSDVFRARGDVPPEVPVSPAVSSETLRKVQGISYTPRSEFLRKVQRKVSGEFREGTNHEESVASLRSLRESSRNFQDNRDVQNEGSEGGVSRTFKEVTRDDTDIVNTNQRNEINIQLDSTIVDPHPGELIEVPVEVHRSDTSSIIPVDYVDDSGINRSHKSRDKNFPKTIRSKHRDEGVEEHPRDFSPEIETILPPRVAHKSRNVSKKTISSTRHDDEGKGEARSRKRDEKVVRTLSQKSCYDASCLVNERHRGAKKSRDRGDHDHGDQCLSHLVEEVVPEEDRETLELRKFREKNYFDTHESGGGGQSCESSGSLEQFQLNDRLFPEPVGRLSRNNIVVSLKPCATAQMKMVHYFPRNIVRENKREFFGRSKGRHRSCPLTGHAVDLGVLRTYCPADSLALKHQKGGV
ncbi:uncharacterized protein LOC135167819 isoform X2 [Diachasmimorpha longicaudata]